MATCIVLAAGVMLGCTDRAGPPSGEVEDLATRTASPPAPPRSSPTKAASGSVTATASATAAPVATATTSPSPTPAPASSVELRALPSDTRFGIAAVDAALDALMSGDVDVLVSMVDWELRACASAWEDGPPSPPRCLPSEADGTPVEAVLVIQGEGSYLREADLRGLLTLLLAEERHLCRVGRIESSDGQTYSIVLRRAFLAPTFAFVDDVGIRLHDGGISGITALRESVPLASAACGASQD